MADLMPDYALRWDPQDPGGHVESHFYKANDPDSDRALWIKFTVYSPVGGTPTVGEVWAILFDPDGDHLAAKETYPIAEMVPEPGGLGLSIGDSRFLPGHLTGRITAPDGTPITWDLLFDCTARPMYFLPYEWMYTAPFPRAKFITPTSDSSFHGFIEAGERRYEVRAWPGMHGRNWGRSHAERHAWGQVSLFDDPGDGSAAGAVFEGISARIKVGPVTTPYLTVAKLVHRGIEYAFNGITSLVARSVRVEHTGWDFTSVNGRLRLHGSLWTTTDKMVGLYYRNPNGDVSHCLNSKIAHCELRLEEAGETRVRLRSTGKAALEILVKESDHPVKMYV